MRSKNKKLKIIVLLIISFSTNICLARNINLKEFEIVNSFTKEENFGDFVSVLFCKIKAASGTYLTHNTTGLKEEKTLYKFYLKVAERDPIGDFLIGYSYNRGSGVEKNLDKANEFYMKAAARGSEDAKYIIALEKHFALTKAYLDSKNGDKILPLSQKSIDAATTPYLESIKIFHEIADLGHDYAQIIVAFMYINGEIDTNNYDKAKIYLNKAIKQNKATGYAALGAMYNDMRNIKLAKKYLKLASEEGSIIAPIILAQNYVCGIGVEKNIQLAEKYKNIAIKNGARNRDLNDLNDSIKDNCKIPFVSDSEDHALKYNSKDIVIDYLSRNRFTIGIIPSFWKYLVKTYSYISQDLSNNSVS